MTPLYLYDLEDSTRIPFIIFTNLQLINTSPPPPFSFYNFALSMMIWPVLLLNNFTRRIVYNLDLPKVIILNFTPWVAVLYYCKVLL